MKTKNLSWILFVVAACMMIALTTTRTLSAPAATVSVQPKRVISPPPIIGETFEINITVSNVADVYTWQAGMTFNSSVLEALSFEEGSFLKTWADTNNQTTLWVEGTIDNVAGTISNHGCALTGPITGASGNGTLGTITFKVKNYGNSALNLTDILLLDSTLIEIPINVTDGYFEFLAVPHDVAVINVVPSATTAYVGQSLNITVTAMNEGTSIETFNVTAYYNTTLIVTQAITNLASGASATVNFIWDTTGVAKGSYTISGNASEVTGETDTADNGYVDGIVKVKILGDVDGDGDVDSMDLFTLAAAYGTHTGDPLFNVACDFDGDGDVDSMDLFALAANYGKT